jgi:hypothetical protein
MHIKEEVREDLDMQAGLQNVCMDTVIGDDCIHGA